MFSGGGPLGALQVGAVKALLEQGVVPEITVGTSVGALNATFLAFEPNARGGERLHAIWGGVQDGDLFPGARFRASWARMFVSGDRVFDNAGIRRLIETRLPNATFEQAAIPLGVIATELDTGAEKLFTSGPVLEPLLASTAMPGIYPPVAIDGVRYIDGGVANNVPIAPAIGMGARTIYVMDSTSHAHQRRPLNRPMDYLLHAFSLARSQRMTFERLHYEGAGVKLVMLPSPTLDFFVPFASMAHTEKLMELGYDATQRFLTGRTEAVVEATEGGAVEAILPAK